MIPLPGGAQPTKVDLDEFESREPRIKTTEEKSYSKRYIEQLKENTGAKYKFNSETKAEPDPKASEGYADKRILKIMFGFILIIFLIIVLNAIYKRHKRKQEEIKGQIQNGYKLNMFDEFRSSDMGRNILAAVEGLAFLGLTYLGVSLVVGIYNKASEIK